MTQSDKIKELEKRVKELELESKIEELEKGRPRTSADILHQKSVINSVWEIGIGGVMGIIGSQVGNMFAKGTWPNAAGVVVLWAGVVCLMVGVIESVIGIAKEHF